MPTNQWSRDNPDRVKATRRRWYSRNAEHAKSKVAQRKKGLDAWFVEYKSKLSCSKCEENHPACLEFHHLDLSVKEVEISKAVKLGWSIERIEREIEKCLVLCSNCHRKVHYEERISNGEVAEYG